MGYKFSEASFAPPSEAEYRQVATAFVAEVAPSLADAVRERLAARVTASMFDDKAPPVMEDPLLDLNRHWVWPELAALKPHVLPPNYQDNIVHRLWEPAQWFAWSDAERLTENAEHTSVQDWLWNVSMIQVRAWRDKLLPDRPKRGSKRELLWSLKAHPDFSAEVEVAFEAWRQALRAEAATLFAKAKERPKAMHLEWLSQLTAVRLDNHHSLTNSCEGPEAFQAALNRLCSAAACHPPMDEAALDRELAEAFSFEGLGVPAAAGIGLAKSYVDRFRDKLTPAAITAALRQYTPGRQVYEQCIACEQQPIKRTRQQPPFNILCKCRKTRWAPATHHGSMHDWDFGGKVDREVSLWALDRLLGVNQAQLDHNALSVRLYVERLDARIEQQVAESTALKAASRGRRGR